MLTTQSPTMTPIFYSYIVCASIHCQTSDKCLSKSIDPINIVLTLIIFIQEIIKWTLAKVIK